jgi:hypothetical protein
MMGKDFRKTWGITLLDEGKCAEATPRRVLKKVYVLAQGH